MPLSTGGPASSRTFDARMMKRALDNMPSSQAAEVRSLAVMLDERTQMGYYAALDFIASLGLYFSRTKST